MKETTMHGNPDRPNKYEREASEMIHKVERAIHDWLKATGHFPGPGIRVDPQLFYSNDDFPSRFLELYLGPKSSIQVGVQRNIKGHAPWSIGWNFYVNGITRDTGEFDARGISQIGPELTKKIIGRYEYLLE